MSDGTFLPHHEGSWVRGIPPPVASTSACDGSRVHSHRAARGPRFPRLRWLALHLPYPVPATQVPHALPKRADCGGDGASPENGKS